MQYAYLKTGGKGEIPETTDMWAPFRVTLIKSPSRGCPSRPSAENWVLVVFAAALLTGKYNRQLFVVHHQPPPASNPQPHRQGKWKIYALTDQVPQKTGPTLVLVGISVLDYY